MVVGARLKEEIREAIPAIIFFVLAFNLIHFTENLMLQPGETQYYSYFTVTLGALAVGKILIIADYFSFIEMFPNKPLIYNIVWKTIIYSLFSFLFRITEHFVHIAIKFRSVSYSFHHLTDVLYSPVFWSVQCWLFGLFIIYCIGHEVTEKIGPQKISHMIWGR